nr:large subunit ribosomal protein L3 [uncultured archaeon]
MPTRRRPRKGSLQFWPRKRAYKFLPSVNWNAINSGKNIKGFIAYKAAMTSAIVKDNTANSMTKGKKIAIPITILECPSMRILSVRFYKNNKVAKEILVEKIEKEMKKKIKFPKKIENKIDSIKLENYDDIRIICYSQVKKTNIKKTPDISEIGLNGNLEEKFKFAKEHLNKEIHISQVFEKGDLTDIRGLTTGKGFVGPVKRFGITLKSHKSEKGVRRPGSLGPWHPARVTFRAPQAGQLGMFTRAVYNNKIIEISKPEQREIKNLKNFGDIKTDYLIVRGSVQGPSKRQLIITSPLRKTKEQFKKELELIELK